jgi:hypothetical protein
VSSPPQERHCRWLATHEPHEYQRKGWEPYNLLGVDLGGFVWVPTGPMYACPGNPHVEHDQRCCREHGTHSSPHIGCVLR